MLKGAIARRYAEAMFNIAKKQGNLDRTNDDLGGIAKVFSHRTLAYLLKEPKVSLKRKEDAIHQSLAQWVLPTSLNLALLIVQRELVEITPRIASEFNQLVLDYKNEAIAEVTSASELDAKQLAQVKDALEQRTGKHILMHTKIRPEILGGVVARVGDQIIDGSIRYRLSSLQHDLLDDVAAMGTDDTTVSFNGAPVTGR